MVTCLDHEIISGAAIAAGAVLKPTGWARGLLHKVRPRKYIHGGERYVGSPPKTADVDRPRHRLRRWKWSNDMEGKDVELLTQSRQGTRFVIVIVAVGILRS